MYGSYTACIKTIQREKLELESKN